MCINSVRRISAGFMPGYIVHPRFIAMRLLCGGGEGVSEVVEAIIGREMYAEGAFEENERDGNGGADTGDIPYKSGMKRDFPRFRRFPFFLFRGLDDDEAGRIERQPV